MVYMNEHYSYDNVLKQYTNTNSNVKKQIHEIIIDFNQSSDKSINKFNEKDPLQNIYENISCEFKSIKYNTNYNIQYESE